jgi:uncharacterized protein YkvS
VKIKEGSKDKMYLVNERINDNSAVAHCTVMEECSL